MVGMKGVDYGWESVVSRLGKVQRVGVGRGID